MLEPMNLVSLENFVIVEDLSADEVNAFLGRNVTDMVLNPRRVG